MSKVLVARVKDTHHGLAINIWWWALGSVMGCHRTAATYLQGNTVMLKASIKALEQNVKSLAIAKKSEFSAHNLLSFTARARYFLTASTKGLASAFLLLLLFKKPQLVLRAPPSPTSPLFSHTSPT